MTVLIDNLYISKFIGKSTNCELYLSYKKNDFNHYLTKKFKNNLDSNYISKFKNELIFIKALNHSNIIKFIDIKKTKDHLYEVFEFCNGGDLSTILDSYQQKFDKPFSEEIIQHLMKQIIDGVKYIHFNNIIHNDLKLKSIFVNFDNEEDKTELNLMKSQIKISHFKLAGKSENLLKKNIFAQELEKQPKYLEKDKKIDILDLGKMCYKMALGKYAIESENLEKIMDEIEQGKYNIPYILSKDIIFFIKDMVRMNPKQRLKIDDLYKHEFLGKNFKINDGPKDDKIIEQEDKKVDNNDKSKDDKIIEQEDKKDDNNDKSKDDKIIEQEDKKDDNNDKSKDDKIIEQEDKKVDNNDKSKDDKIID